MKNKPLPLPIQVLVWCAILSSHITIAQNCGSGTLPIPVVSVNCNGTYSVVINLEYTNTGPCTWSEPNESSNPCTYIQSGLEPGLFSVTVTDGNNSSLTYCSVLNQLNFPSLPNFNITNESCTGNDGSITFNPIGFTVIWVIWFDSSNNLVAFGTNSISNLSPGNYSCWIQLTINGSLCTSIVSPLTVAAWEPLAITVSPPPADQCGGEMTFEVSGGSGVFSAGISGLMDIQPSNFDQDDPLQTIVSGGFGSIGITVTDQVFPQCTASTSFVYTGSGCAADLDGNGVVVVQDLLEFMSYFQMGNSNNCSPACCADFNGDGVVNLADLLIFIAAFGSFC